MHKNLINPKLKISPDITIRNSKVIQVLSAEVTIPFIKSEEKLKFKTNNPEAIFLSIYYQKISEEYGQSELIKIVHDIVRSSPEVSQVQLHTFFQWFYWGIEFNPCEWRMCSQSESDFFHTNMNYLFYDVKRGFNLSFKEQHQIFRETISDVI